MVQHAHNASDRKESRGTGLQPSHWQGLSWTMISWETVGHVSDKIIRIELIKTKADAIKKLSLALALSDSRLGLRIVLVFLSFLGM